MEKITLKNSDLTVSRFCMGGCPMGGYGWGNVQEKELIDAIHTALDEDVNFFDTSDTYGLGQSEITLGKGLGNHRRDVVIATKFGVRVTPKGTIYDNSHDYIQEALENSLKRLGTDYIDVYIIHYRDGKTPINEVVGKLIELRDAGKIRYFGLSNIYEETMDEIKPYKETLQSMVDKLGIRFGSVNVELVVDKSNRVWPIDIGPRAGGNMIPDLLGMIFGVDVVELAVLTAMGEQVKCQPGSATPFYATHNLHTNRSGTYKRIEFSEELERRIIRKCIYKKAGDRAVCSSSEK